MIVYNVGDEYFKVDWQWQNGNAQSAFMETRIGFEMIKEHANLYKPG